MRICGPLSPPRLQAHKTSRVATLPEALWVLHGQHLGGSDQPPTSFTCFSNAARLMRAVEWQGARKFLNKCVLTVLTVSQRLRKSYSPLLGICTRLKLKAEAQLQSALSAGKAAGS